MAKKDEKDLSFEDFKERVYSAVGYLDALDENFVDKTFKQEKGCLGLFLMPFGAFVSREGKKARKELKIQELTAKADALLAERETRDLLCANLDATVTKPIEAAYKLTPVLYELAKKGEEKVPLNSYFFAIVCRKIAAQGVENYCKPAPKKGKKEKAEKTEGN